MSDLVKLAKECLVMTKDLQAKVNKLPTYKYFFYLLVTFLAMNALVVVVLLAKVQP